MLSDKEIPFGTFLMANNLGYIPKRRKEGFSLECLSFPYVPLNADTNFITFFYKEVFFPFFQNHFILSTSQHVQHLSKVK